MIKHHGVRSAGQTQDGVADGSGPRRQREQRTGAAGIVPAVGSGSPGGVGRDLGGGSYVNGDRAITGRLIRQLSVAGIDGETGQDSGIAAWGSAGSEDGGAAEIVAGGSIAG